VPILRLKTKTCEKLPPQLCAGTGTSHQPERAVFGHRTFPRALEAAADGRAEFLVAELNGTIIGYILAARQPTLFAGGTVLDILELTVDASYRGQGTGSLLVQAVIARAEQADDVEVTVPTRRAAGFYSRLGFTGTATYLKHARGRGAASTVVS
jgi:ribosomal protein S18 acetylase RimI-like enzyme